MTDFRHGNLFSENSLFSLDEHALQIFLYFDEFEIVNPLGPHKKKHKLCGFYYVLGNLYPENRASLPMIQLVALCRSRDMKYFGIEKILQPMMQDLKVLETEGVSVPGVPKTFRGTIAFVAADNLGSHMIGGFLESFSGKKTRICRFCMATSEGIQNPYAEFQPRSRENYDHHLEISRASDQSVSVYGIKHNSVLNELKYFHVTSGLPPDVMHDILEGVSHIEFSLVLKELNKQGQVDLKFLNQQIETWRYGPLDRINKPVEIGSDFTIKQTSARMWCLMRLLPLYIGCGVPENNPHWNLLLLLRTIAEYVFSPKMSKQLCAYLHTIILEHNSLFKTLFPGETLKPKHHFLTHYAQMIMDYGPLRTCWCMRFEAKHRYFKSLVVRLQNYINAPSMLAKRHERMQAYQFSSSPESVADEIEVVKSIQTKMDYLSDHVKAKLKAEGFAQDTLIQAEVVHYSGVAYHKGMYLVTGFTADEVIFGHIEACFYETLSKKLVFLVSEQLGIFDSHLGAYLLATESFRPVDVINREDMHDCYPLSAYNVNGKVYIVLKHCVFDTSLYQDDISHE